MKNFSFADLTAILKSEAVLVVALLLAIISSFYNRPDWHSIDFNVLGVLFSLMLVVCGLKSIQFLDWLALELLKPCGSFRSVTWVLVGITFVASMFVTNDVALITFVPLALIIGKAVKLDMVRPIVLMTLAANLGSMLTPQGNPQNLFLFTHYGYTAERFLTVMSVPVLMSVVYIALLVWRTRDVSVEFDLGSMPRPQRSLTILYLVLLALNIAGVLHYIDKWLVLGITAVVCGMVNWRLLLQVDYGLLLTFVGFFIFIGNIQHTEFVVYLKNSLLGTLAGTYVAATLTSQFISNVPAAMLLAGLTNQADALLVGVNVGGLGTLIASMASVISYKFFTKDYPSLSFTFLQSFSFYNFAGLLLIGLCSYGWLVLRN
ncbi:MAG: citrate transporter [Acidaminococcaceae bacterium]|nr:citrate transporter [Acidaminococcaceae bacterium]